MIFDQMIVYSLIAVNIIINGTIFFFTSKCKMFIMSHYITLLSLMNNSALEVFLMEVL